MYTRVVEVTVKSGKGPEIAQNFNDKILPVLKSQPGFVDALVLRSDVDPNRVVAISIWQKKEDADRYGREQYENVSKAMEHLSEGKPAVRTFNVEASTIHKAGAGKAA
jgi:heme-degrading monooxygenase HmoA